MEEQAKPSEFEAWIWILGGVFLAVFAALLFLLGIPQPTETGGVPATAAIIRTLIRVGLFVCGCLLARNGLRLLKR